MEDKIELGNRQYQEEILIFLHIMKAGGTTLNGIINQQYPRNSIFRINGINSRNDIQMLPKGRREKIKLIRGHFAFGLHYFIDCPATYFTMMRDPIERFVSLYYYIQRDPQRKVEGLSLEDFIVSRSQQEGNIQTKMLCGLTPTREGRSKENVLEIAKDNLDKHFSSVGILERFEESLVLFRKKFDWNFPLYLQQNKTTRKNKEAKDLSKEFLMILEESNAMDIELYKYASQKFQEEVERLGESFEQELRLQQHFNSLYQPFGTFYNYARSQYFKYKWNQ